MHTKRSNQKGLNSFPKINVVDDFDREVLEMGVDFNLQAQRVVRTRERIAAVCGDALKLRLDIGPGLISGKWWTGPSNH